LSFFKTKKNFYFFFPCPNKKKFNLPHPENPTKNPKRKGFAKWFWKILALVRKKGNLFGNKVIFIGKTTWLRITDQKRFLPKGL